jgi:anaphase-promoting complex subunit 6
LLTRPFPTSPPTRPASPTPLSNGHFHSAKGKGREYDASQLMLSMPRLPMGPAGMIELPEELQDRVSRLVDMSVACRYLAALCQVGLFALGRPFSLYVQTQVRQGKWDDAIEMLGDSNPFQKKGRLCFFRTQPFRLMS